MLGFDTGTSETPITPVITGESEKSRSVRRPPVRRRGVLPGDRVPDGGQGSARVRTIVTADHTDADLTEALEIFGRVGRELGLV